MYAVVIRYSLQTYNILGKIYISKQKERIQKDIGGGELKVEFSRL